LKELGLEQLKLGQKNMSKSLKRLVLISISDSLVDYRVLRPKINGIDCTKLGGEHIANKVLDQVHEKVLIISSYHDFR
jgi:hypothetical protein